MQEPFDLTTIVFALLAAFVVWKLRSVLGTRTGDEPPRRERAGSDRPSEAGEGNVIRLPGAANDAGHAGRAGSGESELKWAPYAVMGSPVWKGLNEIELADPAFNPREFLEGAKSAYEMIVGAFAAGDRNALRTLLADDVYESFSGAIAEREARGDKVETTFVSIDKAEFTDVSVRGGDAQIALRFQSKLISATRNRAGEVIDGSADKVVDMVDLWTFARDLKSRDPNWRLVATEAGH
ncbi:MAG: calcium-binding protein [Hyphomicrobiales bacterium]|jgi:predicted lipid-binding transport protein (Tim44 family)|nr:calcium-binding protein [Hyphomicrobiales bacterium]